MNKKKILMYYSIYEFSSNFYFKKKETINLKLLILNI